MGWIFDLEIYCLNGVHLVVGTHFISQENSEKVVAFMVCIEVSAVDPYIVPIIAST